MWVASCSLVCLCLSLSLPCVYLWLLYCSKTQLSDIDFTGASTNRGLCTKMFSQRKNPDSLRQLEAAETCLNRSRASVNDEADGFCSTEWCENCCCFEYFWGGLLDLIMKIRTWKSRFFLLLVSFFILNRLAVIIPLKTVSSLFCEFFIHFCFNCQRITWFKYISCKFFVPFLEKLFTRFGCFDGHIIPDYCSHLLLKLVIFYVSFCGKIANKRK